MGTKNINSQHRCRNSAEKSFDRALFVFLHRIILRKA